MTKACKANRGVSYLLDASVRWAQKIQEVFECRFPLVEKKKAK